MVLLEETQAVPAERTDCSTHEAAKPVSAFCYDGAVKRHNYSTGGPTQGELSHDEVELNRTRYLYTHNTTRLCYRWSALLLASHIVKKHRHDHSLT